eukprot:463343_1
MPTTYMPTSNMATTNMPTTNIPTKASFIDGEVVSTIIDIHNTKNDNFENDNAIFKLPMWILIGVIGILCCVIIFLFCYLKKNKVNRQKKNL